MLMTHCQVGDKLSNTEDFEWKFLELQMLLVLVIAPFLHIILSNLFRAANSKGKQLELLRNSFSSPLSARPMLFLLFLIMS